MSEPGQGEGRRRDDAARAAWLYFVAGRTQDEIAGELALSRQAVQRLVAFAVGEKLIKFRLDHPVSACMELAARLKESHRLDFCDVALGDPARPESRAGVAAAVAQRLQRLLSDRAPIAVCVGTGRTMRAAVEEIEALERPQHKILSLVGSMAASGHASPYDVVMRLGDRIGAQRFPLPLPLVTERVEGRVLMQGQRFYHVLRDLREEARASFFGIGELEWGAPMQTDGFLTDRDLAELVDAGAVGEMSGWPFDAGGQPVLTPLTERITSLPLEIPPRRQTVIAGAGPRKVAAIRGALAGGLVTALVTDEATARALLA